jgi:hypothetical protein
LLRGRAFLFEAVGVVSFVLEELTMGMSTHVVGFKPPDEKWRKMKAVWDACEAAGTDPPAAVSKFFEGDVPMRKTGLRLI